MPKRNKLKMNKQINRLAWASHNALRIPSGSSRLMGLVILKKR